ncbi:MAG: serine/threonine-protein kinase [bacterium]|nr:serine/threonine-protein kinase [bacterium]MDI1335755.1 serine/threonine-protein kinase [Lacunisphaera sp.]
MTASDNTAPGGGRDPDRAFGRFEIIGGLAANGQVTVLVGRVNPAGSVFALKVGTGQPARSLVEREATLALSLAHPAIVRYHELVKDDASSALVMELVDGATLAHSRRLMPNQAYQFRSVVQVADALLGALAYLHEESRLVHADVCPDNILLDDRGRILLADFGSAFRHGQPDPEAAARTHVVAYSSPAVIAGRVPGPADDVYAAGAVLYELLAGKLPFAALDPTTLTRRISGEIPPALDQRGPLPWPVELPAGWSDTIQAMLCPSPEGRPSAAEARRLLVA